MTEETTPTIEQVLSITDPGEVDRHLHGPIGHVRVDILHQNFSAERKARIECFAIGWLLVPFVGLMTDVMLHYAYSSVIAGEGSSSPNGLHRVYLLKIAMPTPDHERTVL